MRLVAISDTHQCHEELTLPEGDVLIHAGDWTHRGRIDEIAIFLDWFIAQKHKHKILICGNHDMYGSADTAGIAAKRGDFHYLEDSATVIDGVKFHGSPWTPAFGMWGFMTYSAKERKEIWGRIPHDTDVLITHGPPYGHLDLAPGDRRVGDDVLLEHVTALQPKVHIFGHIHEGYGETSIGNTRLFNVATLDGMYREKRGATVIDI